MVFAGTYANSVFLSPDMGLSWHQISDGMGSHTVNAMHTSSGYVFAGTDGYGTYRRLISELIGIQTIGNSVPKSFSLYQNYPNPFNPSTKINFGIPKSAAVKLLIYDMLGREAAILVNEELKAGNYSVEWNALSFASGVYFYRIESIDFTQTKKMVLIK